jgi:hypothetical protein
LDDFDRLQFLSESGYDFPAALNLDRYLYLGIWSYRKSMPRGLIRPEAIKRLAIRAVIDAIPGLSHQQVAAAFHASSRTVTLAAHRTVERWFQVVKVAPPPSAPARASRGPATLPAPTVPVQEQAPAPVPLPSVRWGSRERAKLVPPDPDDVAEVPELPAKTEFSELQEVPEPDPDTNLPDVRRTTVEEKRFRKKH